MERKIDSKDFLSDDNVLILALYLSKFSERAYKYMGFKNWTETYLNIAKKSKKYKNPNSINNLRDSFDPNFNNGRAGWHQRNLSASYQKIYDCIKIIVKKNLKLKLIKFGIKVWKTI